MSWLYIPYLKTSQLVAQKNPEFNTGKTVELNTNTTMFYIAQGPNSLL